MDGDHAARSRVAPGLHDGDSRGDIWFVSFDGAGYPEAATGAILVANTIFWTLGYWQVENYLITDSARRPRHRRIGDLRRRHPADPAPDADRAISRRSSARAPPQRRRPLSRDRRPGLPGKPLGGFRYHGTRPDDPNDVVPHEHRRELRALKVFAAWTNLVDMKAGNTLDTVMRKRARRLSATTFRTSGRRFGSGAQRASRIRRGLGVSVRRRSS